MKKFSLFILSLLFCTGYMSGADWNVYVARYKQDKACAISYTFDDGLAEHYTLVAPQLEKRGFRGTFWICGSNINKDNRNITDTTRMTWPQLKEMSDKGHEISNHGWAHKNFARFPIEEIKEDILKNDSAIFANTGVMPRTFCYPNNNKKAEGRRIAVQNRVGTRTHQRSIGSKSTLQDLEKNVLADQFNDLANKNLPQGIYERLLNDAQITATSYADRVEFNTLYGNVTLPRIRSTNRLWMPKWEISLLNKGTKKCVIDKNTQITVTYFTGTQAELADFGNLRIVSQ